MAGTALLVAPLLLGMGSTALSFAITSGIAVIAINLMTQYRFGLFKIIPFTGHLLVESILAVSFIFIPFIFSLSGIDAYFFWFNAVALSLVIGFTKYQ